MLHSHGELLLMLDADGATKVTDLEKLESEIHKLGEKELKVGAEAPSGPNSKISDIAIASFGSRAHFEKQALARVCLIKSENFHYTLSHLSLISTAGLQENSCKENSKSIM